MRSESQNPSTWEASGFAQRDRELVADEPAATAGQDRRTAGETCTVLLAAPGGRTSEPAAVRGDAGPNRAVADTDGIDRWWARSAAKSASSELGGGEVLREWANGAISAVLVRNLVP